MARPTKTRFEASAGVTLMREVWARPRLPALAARLASAYERVATLLGCRLRPEAGVTYEAGLANATMRGLVIMGPSSPEIGAGRFTANPAGAPQEAQWSHPALGLEWTAQDTERFRAELSAEDWLTTTSTKTQ